MLITLLYYNHIFQTRQDKYAIMAIVNAVLSVHLQYMEPATDT